ncbi:vWA domain-containing protein [Acetivibrio straminisolvens]|nr:VWA domain-containing protein [Acetivibrio straminisolvens]
MKMNIITKHTNSVVWVLVWFFLIATLLSSCSVVSVKEYTTDSAMLNKNYGGQNSGTVDIEYNQAMDIDVFQTQYNTEDYNVINENVFLDTYNNPLSTFSVDVDTASYSNIRRFLNSSQKPPIDAVRIEEMINYFTYDYPDADGNDPFSITTEIGECPWNPENNLMLVGLQAKKLSTEELPPSNLVFLLDVSGSMDTPDKLPLLKSAFKLLVDELGENDRVSIVVYAGAAGLVLDSTPGSEKDKILDALMELEAGGSTAGAEGIKLAYDIAKKNFIKSGNNRVILATDGDFNVGVSSEAELVRLIEKKRNEGIFLTVLGFGTGNYKDSKMESLADKGNGNYAYIDNIAEARKVLVNEMGATLNTVAKDVKIQVEFNPAKVKAYRLIGYENRLLRNEDFNDDSVDAGEIGAGHSVTALYEIAPVDSEFEVPGVDELKYQKSQLIDSNEVATVKIRYKKPESDTSELLSKTVLEEDEGKVSENLKFAAAVAEFGLLLRESKYKGNSSYDRVLQVAKQYADSDEEGYRNEFVKLVEKAKRID